MQGLSDVVIAETKLRFEGFVAQIRQALDVFSDEELWRRPSDESNAVGNLVLHLCGSTRHFLGRGVGGNDFVRDRPREFAERGPIARAELIRVFEETVAEANAVLAAVYQEQLLEVTDRVGSGGPFTKAALLMRVTHHWAVHTGQIVYLAKASHGGAVREWWIKTMRGR